MTDNGNKMAIRTGWVVLLVLAVLTGVEYVIATAFSGSLTVLGIVALVKAGVIVNYFMHIGRTLNPKEGDH